MCPRALSIFRAEAYLAKSVGILLQYTVMSVFQRANYELNALADDDRHH